MNDHKSLTSNVTVGLSGWGDHKELYEPGTKSSERLRAYSRHFPLVEMDSSFYTIPAPARMQKWSEQTPEEFGFIVKAFQGMTGHTRGEHDFEDARSMFDVFKQSADVLKGEGKLRAVLFQYPPWFDCTKENVAVLRRTREWMQAFPIALEFRHQSWFTGDMREKTLAFMRSEGWIHSICDEPQAGIGSIPTVLSPTSSSTLIRMHGRNISGWNASGAPNWREVRYLYRYQEKELLEWKSNLEHLLQTTDQCWVVFNNNSGGDAGPNAKQFMRMCGVDIPPGGGEQLTLF